MRRGASSLRRSFFLLCFALPSVAHAGAWLQSKSHGLLIAQSSWSRSTKVVDRGGHYLRQPTYSQTSQNLYGEWGVTDKLTLGLSGNYTQAEQYEPVFLGSATGSAITEPTIFARFPLRQTTDSVLSLQPLIQLPRMREEFVGRSVGSPNTEYGLMLGYGRSLAWRTIPMFLDAELGYRLRASGDQIRTDATFGATPFTNWQSLIQAFGTWRVMSESASFTQSGADDYDQLRIMASMVWAFSPVWSLQAGAFTDVYGRNIGLANGVTIGIWRNF